MIRLLPFLPLLFAACAARPLLPTEGPYALEWEKFTPEDQEKLHGVFDLPTAMVELPLTRVETRTELFEFLLTDLAFTAGVLRAQKKAVYKIWRDYGDPPGQVRFDDTAGICLVAELLKKPSGRWVFTRRARSTRFLGVSTADVAVHEEWRARLDSAVRSCESGGDRPRVGRANSGSMRTRSASGRSSSSRRRRGRGDGGEGSEQF